MFPSQSFFRWCHPPQQPSGPVPETSEVGCDGFPPAELLMAAHRDASHSPVSDSEHTGAGNSDTSTQRKREDVN